jgi:hypothetical protein
MVFKHVISINSIEKNEFVVGSESSQNLAEQCHFVFQHIGLLMGEGHRIGSAMIHYFGGFSQELFDV